VIAHLVARRLVGASGPCVVLAVAALVALAPARAGAAATQKRHAKHCRYGTRDVVCLGHTTVRVRGRALTKKRWRKILMRHTTLEVRGKGKATVAFAARNGATCSMYGRKPETRVLTRPDRLILFRQLTGESTCTLKSYAPAITVRLGKSLLDLPGAGASRNLTARTPRRIFATIRPPRRSRGVTQLRIGVRGRVLRVAVRHRARARVRVRLAGFVRTVNAGRQLNLRVGKNGAVVRAKIVHATFSSRERTQLNHDLRGGTTAGSGGHRHQDGWPEQKVLVVGNGTVVDEPASFSCGPGERCSTRYPKGARVTLIARADTSKVTFAGWKRCSPRQRRTCRFTVPARPNVQAVFEGPYKLTVTSRAGGSIRTAHGGECARRCTREYKPGTNVVVTAVPDPGFRFVAWQGCDSATATCSLTMNGSRAVTATFAAQPAPTLTVAEPEGGAVTSSAPGIDCPGTCTAPFAPGTSVLLTATPAPGFEFAGWSGACSGSVATCVVVVAGPTQVTATFVETFPLTVVADGPGRVMSDAAGISCASATCSTRYRQGTLVKLTAEAAAPETVITWKGPCAASGSTCVVNVDAAKTVTVVFTPPVALSVVVTGSGRVTSDPSGIDCTERREQTCSHSFQAGAVVDFTATPDPGYELVEWSSGCSEGRLRLTLSAPRTVTATFDRTDRLERPTRSRTPRPMAEAAADFCMPIGP
jgi:Divergent InlB B-repeat domain